MLEVSKLPYECSQEALRTPSFDQLMQRKNVMEESSQKMVHQIGKKQLAYRLTCEFLKLPILRKTEK